MKCAATGEKKTPPLGSHVTVIMRPESGMKGVEPEIVLRVRMSAPMSAELRMSTGQVAWLRSPYE